LPHFVRNDSQFYGQSHGEALAGRAKTHQRIRTRISLLIHSHTERDPWLQIQAVIEPLTELIVAPKASGFVSGKEGEAGHPRMVDTA